METQTPNEPNQSPVTEPSANPTPTPLYPETMPEDSTVEPPTKQAFPSTAKKISKKFIIILTTVVIIILAVGGYFAYGYFYPATETNEAVETADQTSAQTNDVPSDTLDINAATSTLTSAADSESTIINTDDSSVAADASATAGNVGDSVDENNF
jgi:cytoskeletal protein RodZ